MIDTVQLTPADATLGRVIGLARLGQAIALNRPNTYGETPSIAQHVDGTRAELAFARMVGADLSEWADYTSGDLRGLGPDVAGWEVRATRCQHGHLIIHPRDDPGSPFVLVLVDGRTYRAAGWIFGIEARRDKWWRSLQPGRPAWCVPQSALRRFR